MNHHDLASNRREPEIHIGTVSTPSRRQRTLGAVCAFIGLAISMAGNAQDDHGNTPETASTLNLGDTLSGQIDADDLDYFRIDIDESGTVIVSTSGDTDTVGRLLDDEVVEVATNDDGGVDRNFRIRADLEAGTHYVEVSGRDTGSYEITAVGVDQGEVHIPDAALREAIENALGVATGATITGSEVATLTTLTACCDIADLTGLEEAVGLTRLTLDRNDISDLSPLAGLAALEFLVLSSNRIEDLTPLSNLQALETLNLRDNRVSQLSTLGSLSALQYLDLPGNEITDLSPLSGLTNLRDIDLADNRITDISALSGLTNLRAVSLAFNAISDTSPLSEMSQLSELDLTRNAVADISPLVGKPMEYLYLDDNRIADLSAVSEMTDLLELTLHGNRVVDLSPLSSLAYMEILLLSSNRIDDVSSLSEMADLYELDLSSNRISDLSPLASLTSLEYLNVSFNAVTDVSALPGLTDLDTLSLTANDVIDITPLGELTALETLEIAGNDIVDLSPLDGLESLDRLDAETNSIIDPRPVSALPAVRYLYLGGNDITDAAPLREMDGVVELSLWRNPLSRESEDIDVPALQDRRVLKGGGQVVPYFPFAEDASRQGFVRIVNWTPFFVRGVWAYGGDQADASPAGVSLGDRDALHINANDLVNGNPDKGIHGSVAAGERLELFTSAYRWRALAYMRTRDGFLTSMHDMVPRSTDGQYFVPIFNPASNDKQVSQLRLFNPGENDVEVEISGVDDAGEQRGPLQLTLAAGQCRTLRPTDLESGEADGLTGDALGDGQGKWRLVVGSDAAIEVMNLLESPTGHLTNLSTVPLPPPDGEHLVPLFPPAEDEVRQGFVRIVNRSSDSGEVTVEAYDDTGTTFGPLSIAFEPLQARQFNSDDWEDGNEAKGLPDGVGHGTGNWRLHVESALDIDVLGYIRTTDGFLTGMHDVVPGSCHARFEGLTLCREGMESVLHHYTVPIFNPASNLNQVSSLRLVNAGEDDATVMVTGMDDTGFRRGPVRFEVRGGASRAVTAQELEAGVAPEISGSLGDGKGKWELLVQSDQAVHVLNLLESPTGHLTNLSTAPTNTIAD